MSGSAANGMHSERIDDSFSAVSQSSCRENNEKRPAE